MRLRHLLTILLAMLTTSLLGCGSAGLRAPETGENADIGSAARGVSATYDYFFQDTVNASSGAKWSISNSSGAKLFALSNTYYSSPKAWVIGQNYWNGENDKLTSIGFTIPDATAGIKFSFYSRWQIAAGDFARVDYSTNNGGSWTQLQAFTNGSDAGYPAWTKYTYSLPDNFSGAAKTYRVRFRFTSDGSGTAWGFGVDSISVYQRQLETPTGVEAGDDTEGPIDITWDPSIDPLGPDSYLVYYSATQNGQFMLLGEYDPQGSASYDAPDSTVYWFKVKAAKSGYPNSGYSHADDGYEH